MTIFKRLFSIWALLALVACSGGGGDSGSDPFGGGSTGGGGTVAAPKLTIALSNSSISSANPATVTATLSDAKGVGIAGQVVTFAVVRGLAVTNVATALTRSDGTAVAVLSPASTSGAGADEVTASATAEGKPLIASTGFTVQATNVTITSFTSAIPSLGAYGQTSLTIGLAGASVGSPVQVTVSSACVTDNKAALSPAKFTATTASVTLQYRDIGCGALRATDSLQAVIDGSASTLSLSLPIASPLVSSLAFISATPETIFLKGSGFTEASSVIFEVRDANSSPLPNVSVSMRLLTLTGGVTMEGGTADVVRASDAQGRVTVRVNSGTLPTPVRVSATIVASTISTVSSNLSVAVGLPSQLNFSLSQGTRNIEGYNIDGTPNTYQIIAADRSGNPVPVGTSINFVTEGGQIEAIKQTQLVNGIARTTANFVSSEPRPVDGRVTITTYALGEESFIDLNGNNVRDASDPFQDLGNIFKDRNFNGLFDAAVDEFVPLAVNNTSACAVPGNDLLRLDPSIPSMPATCDGVWSGAGQVYVRRATETVLSTSAARPLWGNNSKLKASCQKLMLQTGPSPANTAQFTLVAGDTWYGASSDTLNFIVADANPGNLALGLPPRLNPMAAGTTITASTPTSGLTVTLGGGSPVPNTTEASLASVAYSFTDPLINSGVIFVAFRSPSGTSTSVSIVVDRTTPQPSDCATGRPGYPRSLVAAVSSSTQVNLTWSDISDNETGFKIERRAASESSWTSVAPEAAANSTANSITGLLDGTMYLFRVGATNAAGDSAYSNEATATTPLSPPTNLMVGIPNSTAISLTWTDNSASETGFKIERRLGAGPWDEIAITAAGAMTYDSTGLTASTTYTFRIRATNALGNSTYSNEVTATTSL